MTDRDLTSLEYAILGLLDFAPMSGYDVQRIFATTPLGHYSASPGAIYPAMKRLERRGLLTATLDTSTEARPRRVYSLAEAGRKSLEFWLRTPVTREELIRHGEVPVLRFSLQGGHLGRERVIAYLEEWKAVVDTYLDELREHRPKVRDQQFLHQRLALEHGIYGYEAQSRWLEHAIAQVRIRP